MKDRKNREDYIMLLELKDDIILGVVSAVPQIEDEELKEDAELMHRSGISAYRVGIDWAKVEPKEEEYDKEVIGHYRKELKYLKNLGIEPLLTIHHFSNPAWFEKKGGFSKHENAKYYLKLVRMVVHYFGDLVSEYITIDEPGVYAVNAWFYGSWEPKVTSFKKTIDVMSVLAACHIKAYKIIHRERAKRGLHDTKVSFANHLRVYEPKNPKNPGHKMYSKMLDWAFQESIDKGNVYGRV